MTKHTPGPWKCNPHDRKHNYKILPRGYATPISTDEALANARLIATAPELLQAALSVVEAYRLNQSTDLEYSMDILEHVSIKAKGE